MAYKVERVYTDVNDQLFVHTKMFGDVVEAVHDWESYDVDEVMKRDLLKHVVVILRDDGKSKWELPMKQRYVTISDLEERMVKD